MKSPIIATIALFIAFSSISTQNVQAQNFSQKELHSLEEMTEAKAPTVNSDFTKDLKSKIVSLAKGDRVGNGFSLRNGGEVVGIISKSSGGNGSGNIACAHRVGNG